MIRQFFSVMLIAIISTVYSKEYSVNNLRAMSIEDIKSTYDIPEEHAKKTYDIWHKLPENYFPSRSIKSLSLGNYSISSMSNEDNFDIWIDNKIGGSYNIKCIGEKGRVANIDSSNTKQPIFYEEKFEPLCVYYDKIFMPYSPILSKEMENKAEKLKNMSTLDIKILVQDYPSSNSFGVGAGTGINDEKAHVISEAWKKYSPSIKEGDFVSSIELRSDRYSGDYIPVETRVTLLDAKKHRWESTDGEKRARFTCNGPYRLVDNPLGPIGEIDSICLFYHEVNKAN
ncbi:hypothetical protein [Cardiobacterium valvarum]|uniref:Uncharacterized protein n=2 Tax=Cardiobacterium valvarum TaxID=194702 RepID=G9ZHY8_9GAMM|nr:hypothetical protein [Cardiobacterium valvarum]EHM52323.1 hypothetical protein HMPREF9080_02397 [Cardiobacterium valvarum F0432]